MKNRLALTCVTAVLVMGFAAASPAQEVGEATAKAEQDAPKLVELQKRYDAISLINDAMVDSRAKAQPRHKAMTVYIERNSMMASYLDSRDPAAAPQITFEKAMEIAQERLATANAATAPMSNDLDTLERMTKATENAARKQLEETTKLVGETASMEAFIKANDKWEDFVEFINFSQTPEGKALIAEAKAAQAAAKREAVAAKQSEMAAADAAKAQKRAANVAKYQQQLQNHMTMAEYRTQYYYRGSSADTDYKEYYGSW